MSKKANPAAVGLFVIVAILLAVAGLLLLGGGRFFEPSKSFILYFEGDLNGLDTGSPVTSRGVQIGEVKKISLVYDHRTEVLSTPVVVRIFRNNFVELDEFGSTPRNINIDRLVENGLRARLEMVSVITGKMRVSLDFHPEVEAIYKGGKTKLEEIPTIPTPLESFTQRISDLPLEQIVGDLNRSMYQIAVFWKAEPWRKPSTNSTCALKSFRNGWRGRKWIRLCRKWIRLWKNFVQLPEPFVCYWIISIVIRMHFSEEKDPVHEKFNPEIFASRCVCRAPVSVGMCDNNLFAFVSFGRTFGSCGGP